MNALVYLNIDQGVHEGKSRVAPNEKRKNLLGFSNTKQIAKFEVFCWNISFSVNHLVMEGAITRPFLEMKLNSVKKSI